MAVKKSTIGELRLVGHFENNLYRQPYTAGYVDGFSNVVTSVYCKLRQKSTKRINDFGQIEIVSSWQMICRFQDLLAANLTEGTKFVQAGRYFTIVGYNIIDERNFYYEFTLNLITE